MSKIYLNVISRIHPWTGVSFFSFLLKITPDIVQPPKTHQPTNQPIRRCQPYIWLHLAQVHLKDSNVKVSALLQSSIWWRLDRFLHNLLLVFAVPSGRCRTDLFSNTRTTDLCLISGGYLLAVAQVPYYILNVYVLCTTMSFSSTV